MKKIKGLVGKLFLAGMFLMPAISNADSIEGKENNNSFIKGLQIFQKAYRNNSKKKYGFYKEKAPFSNEIFFLMVYDLEGDKSPDIVEIYHGRIKKDGKTKKNIESELEINNNPFIYLIDRNKDGKFEPSEVLYDQAEDLLNYNEIPLDSNYEEDSEFFPED